MSTMKEPFIVHEINQHRHSVLIEVSETMADIIATMQFKKAGSMEKARFALAYQMKDAVKILRGEAWHSDFPALAHVEYISRDDPDPVDEELEDANHDG